MTEHPRPQRSSPRPPEAARVPPHNIDAEASALGAALLAPAAAETLAGTIAPRDFYRPQHQLVADAIVALLASGDAVDAVTVGEHLRRTGQLDNAGGFEFLLELQNATPAISNVAQYARIVRDTAALRRLIGVAAQIADLGYTSTSDPGLALARAGDLMGALGSGALDVASTLEVANIAALLGTNLEPEQPSFFRRSDGGSLLYAGKMHTLQAEPSSGKSWIALHIIAEILAMGGSCVYVDYEDTAPTALRRLLALGVTPKILEDRVRHLAPQGRLGIVERAELDRLLDDLNPDLVVIDGVANALSREGLSEDDAPDYVKWVNLLPRPIARTGAAVLMLDHVVKDKEQQGRWARGTGAKLGEVDGAAYQVKVRVPFSRRRAGYVDLIIAKDRPGGVGAVGETAARIHIDPHANGEVVRMTVDPHQPEHAASDTWKPTVLMGKVWEAVNEAQSPLTATAVKALVHSDKPKLVQEAIARLMAEGYIAEASTPGRRGRHLTIVRPYNGAPPASTTRTEPPAAEQLDLTDEADTSWIDDGYLEQLERSAGAPFYEHPAY